MASQTAPVTANPPAQPFGPEMYEDRSAHVVGASIVLIILPAIAVVLRLLSRWISRAGLWVDDYVVILALVLSWGPNITNLLAVQHGFGKHFAVLRLDSMVEWFKYLYAFEFLYTLSMAIIKFSIISFMYRIFPIVQFRRLLMASLLFVVALTIASVVTSVFQCVPIHAFWESFAGKLAPLLGGRCIDVRLYFLVNGSIMTVTDFVLLALSLHRNYVPTAIWSAAEPSIAVVCACLPSLRPLFVHLIWKNSKAAPTSKRRSITSWRSPKTGPSGTQGSFNRLHELSSADKSAKLGWRQNSVTVLGGRPKGGSSGDDIEEGESEEDVPLGRIRAKTQVVVSISERVDWRDDLF
ncbi:MAG: hypothetical protein Q9208_008517 [Pyrenodesmia sp. 3 TL-2023]